MISDLDTTAPAPTAAQKRRGVKTEPTALIAVGEAPKGFWVVQDVDKNILAVLIPHGLSTEQFCVAEAIACGEATQSSTKLAKLWDLDAVYADTKWARDMVAFGAPPFPKAQRLLFA